MGIFGWVAARFSAAKETVSEKVRCAKEKVTNTWNIFSGKKTFEVADELYERITKRYNLRRKRFETEVDDYTNRIEKHVEAINQSKEKIKRELFPEMRKKLDKIKDISISDDFSVEAYMAAVLSFDSVRSKSELYKINFNKHKFKTTIQSIVTLGVYTRKKATETLYAVQEEEKKIDNEIAKIDAEIVKLKAIEQSLDNVEVYFISLIELFRILLIRIDNSVNSLYIRSMSFAHKIVNQQMSIRRLPLMQRKEVEAIITASHILKAMTEAQITSIENLEKVNSYSMDMKVQHAEMQKVYDAA